MYRVCDMGLQDLKYSPSSDKTNIEETVLRLFFWINRSFINALQLDQNAKLEVTLFVSNVRNALVTMILQHHLHLISILVAISDCTFSLCT